ncbi:MAG: hypothetical protein Q7U75_13260 [Desulfobacterales bacterium]|nr:hypothetical protein [Desulfobacterales bacterium]
MAADLFGASWVPEFLLNRWFQLALITPVNVLHRLAYPPNWLVDIAARAADMNSFITIGAIAAFGYSLLVALVPSAVPEDVRGTILSRGPRCIRWPANPTPETTSTHTAEHTEGDHGRFESTGCEGPPALVSAFGVDVNISESGLA